MDHSQKSKQNTKKSSDSLPYLGNEPKPIIKAKFLPNIPNPKTFLTEPMDQSKYILSKSLTKSRMDMSKFRLTGDSKISISILPKLKASILEQNNRALSALEFQVKGLQQEFNQLLSKK